MAMTLTAHDTPVTVGADTWRPHHSWQDGAVRVGGALSTGQQLDLSSTLDPQLSASHRGDAKHHWLHGRVLVLRVGDTGRILVVPVDRLREDIVREALRRHQLGAYVEGS